MIPLKETILSGTVIINSYDKWYNLHIYVKAEPSFLEPLLTNYFSTQKAVENILDTCGKGVKIFFIEGSGVYDHSPDWCCSHINRSVKAVAEDYFSGPHVRPDTYYNSLIDAVATTTQPHVYIWDGQKWEYRKVTRKRSIGLPWSRSRINK